MRSIIRVTIFFICSFIFCSCATYNPPALQYAGLDKVTKETRDSITVSLRIMSEPEAKAFCGNYFSKELLPVYIEVHNGTSLTIRYTGDGLLNNDIDRLFMKPYSKQSIMIEGAVATAPILFGVLQVREAMLAGAFALAVNTGFLIYNELTEDKQAAFFKAQNLTSLINRELVAGERKQLLLYFEKDHASTAKIRFSRRGSEQRVEFKSAAGDTGK